MGYMRHHAIVVSCDHGTIKGAHREALRIFDWVSPISPPAMHEVRSFFIPPDGSKEGWDMSNEGNSRRDRFIGWLSKPKNRDHFHWVEVQYGDDLRESVVTRNSDRTGANLRRANLANADLRGANLRDASLVNANLGFANLADADLRGSDLTGADLRGTDLTGAKYNAETTWPEDCDPQAAGAVWME